MDITYAELLVRAFTRESDEIAFVHRGRQWSYRESAELVSRIAGALVSRGVGPSRGVAVLSPPRPEAFFVTSAASLIGAPWTALHPLGSLEDHLFICGDGEVDTVVVADTEWERAIELREQSSSVQHVLMLGRSEAGPDLLELAAQTPARPLRSEVRPDAMCYLAYTGGTTGQPKGVMIGQGAMGTTMITGLVEYEIPPTPQYLAASPITHAGGMAVVPTLLRGGTVHLHDAFDPGAYLRAIEEQRISLCFGVPSMIYALLDHPELEHRDLSSLRTFLYAASPMAPARLADGLDRIGPVFTQYYAQSECAAGTVLPQRHHDPTVEERLASCGKPVVTVDLQLRNDEGHEVGAGETGEICLRSDAAMLGYWKRPELTEETIRDGWVHTGDMATADEDGFLTIVDRKKDMIVSGGFNVFPREIEDVLTTHPSVSAAAVIGVPDDRWGEAVKALVVARPGEEVPIADLIELVRERKGAIAAPKTIDLIEEMPLTAVGKADKRSLRQRYWGDEARRVH